MASPQNQFTHATSPLTATGDVLLDSLIGDYKAGGVLGTGAVLSYSFPWSASGTAVWATNSYYSDLNEPAMGYGLNLMQQAAFRSALATWSQVANLQFVEVPDLPADVGDIRIGWTQLPNPGSDAWTWQSEDYWASASDIWLSHWLMGGQPDSDWQAGGFNFMALIHELGHALWLEHPFESSAPMPAEYDTNQYTVMSYTDHPRNLFVKYHPAIQEPDGSWTVSWDVVPVCPSTPMLLDIAAIQHLYGANMSWHTGNDVYTFDPANPFIMTLWDAGGIDTISASTFQTDCLIDLREGHYSSLPILPDPSFIGLEDLSGFELPGPQPNDYDGSDNLAIAWGAAIENAIGGSGNDVLIGNALANLLAGGASNDTLDGGAGIDTVLFHEPYSSANVRFDSASQHFVVTTATDGTDIIRNVELFSFSGQTYTAAQIIELSTQTGPRLTVGDAIVSVYTGMYNRAPDQEGLSFWQQDVQNKFGLQSDSAVTDLAFQRAMVQAFAQFPTYYVLYKDMTDTAFVSQLYVNLQNRTADSGGLGYWVGRINGSIEGADGPDSREKVTADFIYGTLSADYGSDAFVNNFDAPTLAAAQAAQDAARNKIEVAKYYTQVFGALSDYGDIVGSGYFNPNPASPTYEADARALQAWLQTQAPYANSTDSIAGVTSDSATVASAKALVDDLYDAASSGGAPMAVTLVGVAEG